MTNEEAKKVLRAIDNVCSTAENEFVQDLVKSLTQVLPDVAWRDLVREEIGHRG